MERVVDGFFSKAFRSPIQPSEIGRRMLRDMEGAKTVSVGAVYVPNAYHIHLCPEDFDRFEGLIPALRDEFTELLRRGAAERRWQFPGPLSVDFEQDQTVSSGRFEVATEHHAMAEAPAPQAGPRQVVRLVGSPTPKEWVLEGERLIIGRLPDCEVSLADANASRQHAELVRRDGEWWIVDLGSTNGTLVNGSLVRERRMMMGDRIQVGSSTLDFGTEEGVKTKAAPPQAVPDETQAAAYPFYPTDLG
ncbi:MAG: DUF3662 and FHA domain-containing protein [Actinomycetota bacterium]